MYVTVDYHHAENCSCTSAHRHCPHNQSCRRRGTRLEYNSFPMRTCIHYRRINLETV